MLLCVRWRWEEEAGGSGRPRSREILRILSFTPNEGACFGVPCAYPCCFLVPGLTSRLSKEIHCVFSPGKCTHFSSAQSHSEWLHFERPSVASGCSMELGFGTVVSWHSSRAGSEFPPRQFLPPKTAGLCISWQRPPWLRITGCVHETQDRTELVRPCGLF